MILAQVAFQGVSGTPEDRYVNTFHISEGPNALDETTGAVVADALLSFYKGDNAGADTDLARTMFPAAVDQDGHTIKLYSSTLAPPQIPFYEESFSLEVAPTDPGFPEEVALVMSMRGELVAGNNAGPGPHLPARHRNRIYLGPLRTSTAAMDGANMRPTTGFRDRILQAATRFAADLILADCEWWVWSPTRWAATGNTAQSGEPVQVVWVDNAFDTQRRRGALPTLRSSINL